MLIEMSVANFRSFRELQTFSLVKGKGDELLSSNTFSTNAAKNIQLLRSAAIYGPNASGKSNFLLAMRAMRRIVLESAAKWQRGDLLPVTPFRLSPDTRQSPSEFEVTFIVDQVRYQYGFAASAERVHEEWLHAYPKGRPQHWFARAWNQQQQRYDWMLGNNLVGEKQLWQKSTRDNALFLSTAVQLNSEQLQPIFDWFSEALRVTRMGGWGHSFTASLCGGAEKAQVMEFLRAADLGIDDISVEARPIDISSFPDDMPDTVRIALLEHMKDVEALDIKTVHKSSDGSPVIFDLEDESDGTQKLFAFAGPWMDALTNGYVLLIDELHGNLHPRMVQFLVQLFHSEQTNPNNAQLIFTTHETSILNQDVFRRDQIWFCEKNQAQESVLYPLTDFSPRKGRENLEVAYLSGRYGALPFVRPLQRVM